MEELNFDEMRNQIAILKTKLDKQEIVNDRLMRHVVTTKGGTMKKLMQISIFCGLFVIFIGPYAFHNRLGASWAFVIGTDVMMLYCIVRELLFKRQVADNKALMSADMLYVAKNMKNFKDGYKRYTLWNIPIGMAWVIWLFFEFTKGNYVGTYYILGGIAIGLAIGLAVGLKMYFRIQNEASDIIRQIEE